MGRLSGSISESSAEASERANANSDEIKLYMTTWCGYCRKARQLLEDLGSDFEELDVESDKDAAEEHWALTGGRGGVPVVTFGDNAILGFDAASIKEAADRQGNWPALRRQLESQ